MKQEFAQKDENTLTAYELSEKKNRILNQIEYLEQESDQNNTETVLLTNGEVGEIVEALKECVAFIDRRLKTVIVQ